MNLFIERILKKVQQLFMIKRDVLHNRVNLVLVIKHLILITSLKWLNKRKNIQRLERIIINLYLNLAMKFLFS
jgi:hypothetical protein